MPADQLNPHPTMHSSQAHHLDLLTRHALATLPDSTRERKRLLALVVAVLPRNHPTRLTAQALLKMLEQQELLQWEFAHDHARAHAGGPGGCGPWRPHRCARTGPSQPSS